MSVIRLARIVGAAGVIAALPCIAVTAQTQSPPPSSTSPPAATKPETSASPTAPQVNPSMEPSEKAAPPAAADQLVGLTAKSSDGTNLGTVQAAIMEPNGKTAIGVKVGGFLGFGGHIVAIPNGKFDRVGDTVQINMTADEVNKLPKAKTQKSSALRHSRARRAQHALRRQEKTMLSRRQLSALLGAVVVILA